MSKTPWIEPDLVCTYFTLAGNIGPFDDSTASPVSLAERARAASTAGYRGLGFGSDDIAQLLATSGAHEINSILDDNGLVHRELEVLLDWFVASRGQLIQCHGRPVSINATLNPNAQTADLSSRSHPR